MATLSTPTLGLLVDIAKSDRLFTRSDLETLLMRSDLTQYGQGGPNKAEILRSAFRRAQSEAELGDQKAHRGLLTFVRLMLEITVRDPDRAPAEIRLDELRETLLADGYQVHFGEAQPEEWGAVVYRPELLPTESPVPLAPEISALEAQLSAWGYGHSLNHYQQAVENFIHHNYEAANGQLRTTLEDLVIRLARQNAGYTGPEKGGLAINHMVDGGSLPKDEGGLLLQGIWKLTHTRGSHPGQSDADEARFRMLVITAMARFLLNHFP
jgi:hypothetical protein